MRPDLSLFRLQSPVCTGLRALRGLPAATRNVRIRTVRIEPPVPRNSSGNVRFREEGSIDQQHGCRLLPVIMTSPNVILVYQEVMINFYFRYSDIWVCVLNVRFPFW